MSLQDLEVLLKKYWEGMFKKGAGPVQPVEIARALVREMSDKKRVSVSRVYAPNVFTVCLGGDDFEQMEPLQAAPTIIEDKCFIGARAEVAEGVIVGEGSVLSMGVYLSGSTKIIDRHTGEIFQGKVPPYSVVVSGSLPSGNGPNLYCAVIVKRVDEKTRAKTSINELLRD